MLIITVVLNMLVTHVTHVSDSCAFSLECNESKPNLGSRLPVALVFDLAVAAGRHELLSLSTTDSYFVP